MIQIKYQDGYKYQLTEDYSVQTNVKPEAFVSHPWVHLDTDGMLTVHDGYAWDGPSGPTIDTPDSMRGSLVHDALYQLMSEGLLDQKWRETADGELRRLCLEDGMSAIRACAWYDAVRVFGATFARTPKPTRTAP